MRLPEGHWKQPPKGLLKSNSMWVVTVQTTKMQSSLILDWLKKMDICWQYEQGLRREGRITEWKTVWRLQTLFNPQLLCIKSVLPVLWLLVCVAYFTCCFIMKGPKIRQVWKRTRKYPIIVASRLIRTKCTTVCTHVHHAMHYLL